MKDYKEFQFGWVILGTMLPVQVLVTILYIFQFGDRPLPWNAFLVFTLISIITYLLFYGLRTTVSANTVTVVFGIGLIRKNIDLKRISSAESVKSSWWHGWGIRFIPNGMLYSVSGFKAVELTFNDSKRVFRIGTADSAQLKKEILLRLK